MTCSGSSSVEGRRLSRDVWEREMKRLRVLSRVFAAIMLALLARLLKTRISAAGVVAPTLVGALLVGSLWLSHLGHRIEREAQSREPESR